MPPKKQVESRKARQNRARRARQQALAKLAKDLAGISIASSSSGRLPGNSNNWADATNSEHRLKLLPGFTCTELRIEPTLPYNDSKGFAQTERVLTVPAGLRQESNLRINRVVVSVVLDPAVPDADKFWCCILDSKGAAWVAPSAATFPSNAIRITGRESRGYHVYHFPGKTVEYLSNLKVAYYSSNYAGAGENVPVAVTKVLVEHEKIGQAEYIEL